MEKIYVIMDTEDKRDELAAGFITAGLNHTFYTSEELLDEIELGYIEPPRFLFVTNEIKDSPFTYLEKFKLLCDDINGERHIYSACIYFVTSYQLDEFRVTQQSIKARKFFDLQIRTVDTSATVNHPVIKKHTRETMQNHAYHNLFLPYYLELKMMGRLADNEVFFKLDKRVRAAGYTAGFSSSYSSAGFDKNSVDTEASKLDADRRASLKEGIVFNDEVEFSSTKKMFTLGEIKGSGFPSTLVREAVKGIASQLSVEAESGHFSFWEITKRTNELFYNVFTKGNPDMMIVSYFSVMIDTEKETLKYCSFNYDLALFMPSDEKRAETIIRAPFYLGAEKDTDIEVIEIEYKKDDVLIVLSDGIRQNAGIRRDKSWEQLVKEFVIKERDQSARAMAKQLMDDYLSSYDLGTFLMTEEEFLLYHQEMQNKPEGKKQETGNGLDYDLGLIICKF